MVIGEQLKIINNIFQSSAEIKILEPFNLTEEGFYGKIELNALPKETLVFDVLIPPSYPFIDFGGKSIKFICKNASGYLHINEDNSICLITPKSNDFSYRLLLEIEKLKEWRDKYYIREESDDKYDYLIVPNQSNTTFLFTDIKNTFSKNNYGLFKSVEARVSDKKNGFYYITKIGNSHSCLSTRILQQEVIIDGLFYFMDTQPIRNGNGNISFDNWQQFNGVFSQRFCEKLYTLKKDKKNSLLYVLIGYSIPNSTEVHWQAVEIQTNLIPIKSYRKAINYYEYCFIDYKIQWVKTINISPNRFFGRGSVNKKLQESKILIIGCGAIGSSLSKILVRGGCKNIDLCDFEYIETGNICRSEYFLIQCGGFKSVELQRQLHMISPFLESQVTIVKKDISPEGQRSNKAFLNNYEYIMDCSSDDELCVYLDSLKLENNIINMSISNKANELVCVIGRSAIWESVKNIFSVLDRSESVLFYEGTGCWSPTFEASYFDINALLNLAIRNINFRLEKELDLDTFMIKNKESNGYLNLEVIGY